MSACPLCGTLNPTPMNRGCTKCQGHGALTIDRWPWDEKTCAEATMRCREEGFPSEDIAELAVAQQISIWSAIEQVVGIAEVVSAKTGLVPQVKIEGDSIVARIRRSQA